MENEQNENLEQEEQTEEQDTQNDETSNEGENPEENQNVDTLSKQKKHWRDKHDQILEDFEEYKKNNPPKTETKTEVKKTKNKSTELDYGQLAFLNSKGIESDEQVEFIQGVMERTGEDLKDVIKDDYVKNKLKTIKEELSTKEATPTTSKRGTVSGTKDKVDYWIKKGELPPTDQVQLRRDVVNAKIQREKNKSKFSKTPIIAH